MMRILSIDEDFTGSSSGYCYQILLLLLHPQSGGGVEIYLRKQLGCASLVGTVKLSHVFAESWASTRSVQCSI